jgi:hypothetical protein
MGGVDWLVQDATEMKVMLGAHNVREASEEGRIEVGHHTRC